MPKKEEKKVSESVDEEDTSYNQEEAKVNDKITKAKGLDDDDENRVKMANPAGRFLVVELKGDNRYIIINKFKQRISPVISLTEANKLCTSFNMKDPEQRRANNPGQKPKEGEWVE